MSESTNCDKKSWFIDRQTSSLEEEVETNLAHGPRCDGHPSVDYVFLTALAHPGRRRGRLISPYREHLAKHFADTFSGIGLTEPYETEA
jgi:hypothetical protein